MMPSIHEQDGRSPSHRATGAMFTLRLLTSTVLVFWVALPLSAELPTANKSPTLLQQIRSAARLRSQTFDSCRIRWAEKQTYEPGSITPAHIIAMEGQRVGRAVEVGDPVVPTSLEMDCTLIVKQEWMRFTRPIISIQADDSLRLVDFESAYDGELSCLVETGRNGHPFVSHRLETRNSDTKSSQLAPLIDFLRLDDSDAAVINLGRSHVFAEHFEVNGHDCVVLLDRFARVYCDRDRGFIVIRAEHIVPGGRTTDDFQVEYRESEQLGMIPESWRSRRFDVDNGTRAVATATARVTDFQIDDSLVRDDFRVALTSQTTVFDHKAKSFSVVQSDGSRRGIDPTTEWRTGGSPMRRWPTGVGVVILIAGVTVVFVVFMRRAHRGRAQ